MAYLPFAALRTSKGFNNPCVEIDAASSPRPLSTPVLRTLPSHKTSLLKGISIRFVTVLMFLVSVAKSCDEKTRPRRQRRGRGSGLILIRQQEGGRAAIPLGDDPKGVVAEAFAGF